MTEITITGSIVPRDGEHAVFMGFATDAAGRYLATARGKLPLDALQFGKRKRTGRPKDEASHVAALAHFHMAEIAGCDGINSRRLEVARVLGIGNPASPENQSSQVRDKIRKAMKDLAKHSALLIFAGDETGKGRLFILVENQSSELPSGEKIAIDGHGWICAWGAKHAQYGRIMLQGERK